MFDLIQQLSTFSSSIVDKRLDILFETVHAFFHFTVEALSPHETLNEILMRAEDAFVPTHDTIPTLLQGFVFLLIGTYPPVLQKVAECSCELLEKGGLFMYCRDNAILVRAEFLKFRLEELILVVGNGLLVKNENIGNVVVMDLASISLRRRGSLYFNIPFPSGPLIPAFFPV